MKDTTKTPNREKRVSLSSWLLIGCISFVVLAVGLYISSLHQEIDQLKNDSEQKVPQERIKVNLPFVDDNQLFIGATVNSLQKTMHLDTGCSFTLPLIN